MFSNIKQKILGIYFAVDECNQNEDILTVRGWFFSSKSKIKDVYFIIENNKNKYSVKGKYGFARNDVYQELKTENAKESGFYMQAIVENIKAYNVWISFSYKGKEYKIRLGKVVNGDGDEEKNGGQVTEINCEEKTIDITNIMNEKYTFEFPEEFYSECVDIIIPVYNGYKYLEKLLATIEQTDMCYRLILINDNSSDERVDNCLKSYAEDKNNVILLNNKENLGFVRTVNKGFSVSENHIALVNTDVELPEKWLERLMFPIFKNKEIASTTPYTTSGTICSFPEFGCDNKLFLDLNVKQIDNEFKMIQPRYEEMPTGVGFCMGINKDVLDEIGSFDAETFGMGYGEENDWCQRALDKGYKNVQVENLFVFHNHGGSFASEDKKRFIKEHEKLLLKKHPSYNREVARYCLQDPNKDIRQIVELNLLRKYKNNKTILAFDHALGGGATNYLEGQKKQKLDEDEHFVIIRYDYTKGKYIISYYWKNKEISMQFTSVDALPEIIDYLSADEIWINELVTYPSLYHLLDVITKITREKEIPVKMLFHDYFSVCPAVNLVNDKDEYCGIPKCSICNQCLKENKSIQALDYETMDLWREEWKKFLQSCNEIVVFSNSTKEIMEKAFGKFDNTVVIPHQIGYMPQIEKKIKTTKTLNIGLLGVLTKNKGGYIIENLVKKIEKDNLNIRIILIGTSCIEINSSVFNQTGTYDKGEIPRLALEKDIDVFLISSICPETFSYTAEEAIKMGMPVMCFDIGAPAERIKKYSKGIIVPDISPEAICKVIEENDTIRNIKEMEVDTRKVLFVVQEVTFSSRYRVEHLREQLVQKGIKSDCISIKNIKDCNIKEYISIVVYRISDYDNLKKLKSKAQKEHLKVYYDIDDYIFNYDAIKNIGFLKGKEYKNFKEYTKIIKNCMDICDAYIVSTVNLKNVVQQQFVNKKVIINRNVASMEMVIESLRLKKVKKDSITLGYFSGSTTHNDDFESIKDVLISIMKENINIHLLVAGQIELPVEFNSVKNQVERFEFVSWKELPHLLMKADINLMPLENTIFHACKSENKWMEAALVNVPTIASWNNELGTIIQDGVDGFLCKDMQEWNDKIHRLVDDESLRKKMASVAHERVMKEYTTDDIELEVFETIVG